MRVCLPHEIENGLEVLVPGRLKPFEQNHLGCHEIRSMPCHTVQRNIDWMDEQGLIREVTGQGRYRMWRIVEPRSTGANSMPERHDELLAEDFFDVLAALQ